MAESPLRFIQQNSQLFTRVGSAVATYRTRGTTRFGPYYQLIYRQDRRQRSLYLGRSEQLATQVRELLRQLQEPRDLHVAIQRSNRIRKPPPGQSVRSEAEPSPLTANHPLR
jgi:uncharacterized protein DUF1678